MLAFVVALLGSVAMTGGLIPVLRQKQLIDVPNHRSSHASPTPRGGGIAVMSAIALALAVEGGFSAWPVVIAAIVLACLGLIDDLRSLSSGVRLLGQLLSAFWVTVWVALDISIDGSWWWIPLALLALVGYVNAFNFMGGINGISGLSAVLVGAYWAFVGHQQEVSSVEVLGYALAGAAAGFLPWNAYRARVFLGDVGSYGLGLLIGALSVIAWAGGVHMMLALAPLALYGMDSGWVLVKRAWRSKPLMEAHREHVYQRLVDGGWSHPASAMLCTLISGLVCAVALLSWQSSPITGAAVCVVLLVSYLNAPRVLLSELEVPR